MRCAIYWHGPYPFSSGRIEGRVDLAETRADVMTIYGEGARDIFGIKTHVDDAGGMGRGPAGRMHRGRRNTSNPK